MEARGEPFLFTNIALSVSSQGSLVGRVAQVFVSLACDLFGKKQALSGGVLESASKAQAFSPKLCLGSSFHRASLYRQTGDRQVF